MAKDRNITEEQFNDLLDRLGPDREQAGVRYRKLHKSLIGIFLRRGFGNAEEMADEVMDRVAANAGKLKELKDAYFYQVATYLMMERHRQKRIHVDIDDDAKPISQPSAPFKEEDQEEEEDSDAEKECLMSCLDRLNPHERSLVLSYYEDKGRDKIKHRRKIAEFLRISEKALRVRVYRIKRRLDACIQECLQSKEQKGEGNVLNE
jgi:RNA polymerase sigma factor (sigma-70 family)